MFLFPSHGAFQVIMNGKEEHVIKGNAQGTTYLISYVHEADLITKMEIDSIFNVIDHSLSVYQSNSLISIFNSQGIIVMDLHMKKVIEKSIIVSQLSDGAFDITVKPLVDFWKKAGKTKPDKKTIDRIKRNVNYKFIGISGDTLKSDRNGVKIDCDGIAQGYTVDVLYHYLKSKGIKDFLVEVGGEIRSSGYKANGTDWKIGLELPSQNKYFFAAKSILKLKDKAVATAGNYRKFIESNGKIASHIINPVNGFPVDNRIIAVTVIANDAITADAWDDVFFVKGLSWSKSWLEKNDFLEVLILYADQNNQIREFSSKGFSAYLE